MHRSRKTKIRKEKKVFSSSVPSAYQPRSHEAPTAPQLINKSALLRFSWRRYTQDAARGVTTKREVWFSSSSWDEGVPFTPTKHSWWRSSEQHHVRLTVMSQAQGQHVWGLRLVCSAGPSKQCHLEGKCGAHIIQSIIPPLIPAPVIIYLANLIPQVSCEKKNKTKKTKNPPASNVPWCLAASRLRAEQQRLLVVFFR